MATILQILPELSTGGAERTTVDVASALVTRGDRAMVMSTGGQMVAELDEIGAEHIVKPVATKFPPKIISNALMMAKFIVENEVDVIHARSRAPAWSSFLAARRTRIPFVTTYHGAYSENFPGKAYYNSIMVRGDKVIANSWYIADHIRQRYPFAEDNIIVIPRGTDMAAFDATAISYERIIELMEQWDIETGKPILLQLARLTRWKGQECLIAAAEHLVRNGVTDFQIVLAGSEQRHISYKEMLENQIVDAALKNHIRLVGHCADPAAAMALADLVIVPSIEPEAFGRAAVEAQALETPVIVSNLGAVGETVLASSELPLENSSGWRVAPNEPVILANAIGRALALTSAERTAMGQRGRKHVHEQYSLSQMIEKTLTVYDACLTEGLKI